MTDDDMEISSDHGHHGNDDIDIDIDFTTGDADGDGDYMVDDAPPELGFEETLDIPALTPMDNDNDFEGDDIAMFDEAGNESRKVEEIVGLEAFVPMSDASFTDLDNVAPSFPPVSDSGFILDNLADSHMSTAEPVLEISHEQNPSSQLTNTNATTNLIDGHHEQETLSITHASFGLEQETTDVDAAASTHHTQNRDETEQTAYSENPQSTEQVASVADSNLTPEVIHSNGNNESGPSTSAETTRKLTPSPDVKAEKRLFEPLLQEPIHLQAEDTLATESTNDADDSLAIKESTPVNALRSPPNSNPGTGNDSPSAQTSDPTNEQVKIVANDSASEANVTMVWQNAEYTLFPRAESDDPDSFFLSDQKILEQPLNSFLQSIRDIIREEIADEDELCMAIEDLGLEIEESSANLGMYTLGQIIDVFNKLLENDSTPVRPLYVTLAARPSFSRRYGVCLAGAADGRGLSDVFVYRDGSESHHESPNGDDLTSNNLPVSSDTKAQSFSGYPENEETAELTADDKTYLESPKQPLNTEEPLITQDVDSQANKNNSVSTHNVSAGDLEHLDETHESIEDGTYIVNNPQQDHTAQEEDDLLDYSEDEFEETKAQRDTSQIGLKLGGTLNRAENSTESGGEHNALSENTTVGDQQIQKEESDHQDGENDTSEGFENDYIDVGEESLENVHDNDTTTWDKYDDDLGEENTAEVHEPVEVSLTIETGHDSNAQNRAFNENDDFQFFEGELDLGEGPGHKVDRYNFDEDDSTNQHHEIQGADTSKYSLESVDAVDSSATLSADEPHLEENFGEYDWQDFENTESGLPADSNNNGQKDEDEDEIGYEDDEKDVTIKLPPIDPTANGSSKRSISEMEADGSTGLDNPESKRPRS